MFFWTALNIVEPFVYFFGFYLSYVFFFQRDLSIKQKVLFSLPLLITLILGPTHWGLLGYNLSDCDRNAYEGIVSSYGYILEVFYILCIIHYAFKAFYDKNIINRKREIIIFSVGISLFLLSLSLGNIIEVFSENWYIGQYGLFGAPIFVSVLAYLIVRFKTFDIKLIAPQILVYTIIFLNISIIATRQEYIKYVVIFTTTLSLFIGFYLIKTVKKVDEQREALDLANQQKSNLLHFISHQVKGFFTKSRNAFSGLLEGDYGPIPETARHIIQEGFDSDNRGVETVQQILSAANLKTGQTTYVMTEINLVNALKDIILSLKPASDKKSLVINFNPPVQNLIMKLDGAQITQALKNLIDNSIKYTPSGKIDITLDHDQAGKNIVIKIVDTGVGIDAEDMSRLFKEGGRGKESLKVNVDSTGYGLYIVKNIIEAHGGSVTVHSDGVGKGSIFTVVLPIK
jgi:signal transduction histidine kinase